MPPNIAEKARMAADARRTRATASTTTKTATATNTMSPVEHDEPTVGAVL